MTVYVDDMRRLARVGHITARWSHLLADSHGELEAFARRLGLHPCWIQHVGTAREHYDVTDLVRARAQRLGAQPLRYSRETGLYTLLKAARLDGNTDLAAQYQAQLNAARTSPTSPAGSVRSGVTR